MGWFQLISVPLWKNNSSNRRPGIFLIRYQSLLMLDRGLEDIQRGHKNFRAVGGGPLKFLSVKQGAMKTKQI